MGFNILIWLIAIGSSSTTNEHLFPVINKVFEHTEENRCSCIILHDLPNNAVLSAPLLQPFILQARYRSAGVFTVQVKANRDFSHVNGPFKRLIDIGKSRATCTLGIIYVSEKKSLNGLSEWLAFLQGSSGIVKTERDRFIFISQVENFASYMLTSDIFGHHFKFAIAMTMKEKEVSPQVHYLCNMCSHDSSLMRTTSTFENSLFSDKTENFNGKTLRVSTPTSTRWLNEMHTVGIGKWLPKRGIYAIVLDQLMYRYNFTSEFFPSTGGGTGAKVNKTVWVGTVGDVLYRKADIGHVTAVTYQRQMVVDSTFPISYEWLTFTTGQAPQYHTWKTVYWPLTPLIWQLTALTSFLCAVLFKIVLKITGQRAYFDKIVEYMFAVVMEEGVKDPEQYPTHSLRITMVIWLLFGLLMGTAYRSKLTAFLAFPNVEHLPQSFEELAASKYTIGLQYIKGAAYQVLKSSKNPTYVSIFKRMELEESDVRCFKRTINGKFACISWDSMADYVYHKNLTDKYGHAPVVKSPSSTCFLTAGMVLEKRSILKTNFDHFLIWAMDTGMMSKWRKIDHDFVATQRKIWERATNQPETDYTPPPSAALTFSHLSGGYYLFATGMILSTAVFTAEGIYSQYIKCMGWDNSNTSKSSSVSSKGALIEIKPIRNGFILAQQRSISDSKLRLLSAQINIP